MNEPMNPLLRSLRAAVDASPDDVVLRLHLAELLLDAGQREPAIAQLGRVLRLEPTSARALELVARANGKPPGPPPETQTEAAVLEQLEHQFDGVVAPMFVDPTPAGDEAVAKGPRRRRRTP